MSKFSVGQKVICIRDNTRYCKDIIVGQEYTVDALTHKYIYVRNIHGKISGGWELNRFKAKEEVTTAKSLPATDLEKCPDLKENYEEHQKLLAKALVDIKLPPDMIEVTHLKEYCPKGGDVYLTEGANTTYPITSFYAVKHWRPTTRIWATKENYNRYKEDCRHNKYMPMDIKVEKKTEEKNNIVEKVGETFKFCKHSIQGYTYTFKTPPSISASELWTTVAPVVPAPKENKTKSLIGVGKFVTSLGLRGANYWVVEPATAMTMRVVSSVRYMTFVTMLVGGIYSYYNPETAKNTLKSLIPTVSISFEKPPILQGEKE